PAGPPPHSLVAAIWAPPEAVPGIERAMLERFPEAPPIRVAPLLTALAGMLGGVADALSAISGVTILAALIVLAGTVAGGWRVRLREMTMLRVLGARPRQVVLAGLLEFALLGVAASAPAALLGTLAARALVGQVMPEGWVFVPQVPLAIMAGAVCVLALTALGLGARALARPPARQLRERPPS
ncbi:MAG: FtsX-like permease family protein, partial [Alphaproteobacteria bacterium]|nr:FtsX-like permease family protein [Alphaproteobacteria bacterium]